MARKIPVNSWIKRQIVSKDPKFHQIEIFEGAGRSIRLLFTIFSRVRDLRVGSFLGDLFVLIIGNLNLFIKLVVFV